VCNSKCEVSLRILLVQLTTWNSRLTLHDSTFKCHRPEFTWKKKKLPSTEEVGEFSEKAEYSVERRSKLKTFGPKNLRRRRSESSSFAFCWRVIDSLTATWVLDRLSGTKQGPVSFQRSSQSEGEGQKFSKWEHETLPFPLSPVFFSERESPGMLCLFSHILSDKRSETRKTERECPREEWESEARLTERGS